VLVENSDSLGVDVAASLLLVPETLGELPLRLSRLLSPELVKDDEAAKLVVGVSMVLGDSVGVLAEVSELPKELGWLLVSIELPGSVESVVVVASVEKGDVALLESVLSVSVDDREVDSELSSVLVLDSVLLGPGVGPEAEVSSVEMLV
jgi:hypothetical protein